MKKASILLCILFFALSAYASTSISTATVSGHWTTSGSPYLIYNNIQVSGAQSLAIDPGVQVIFQGDFSLAVTGMLYAAGTADQPITFTVSDTTGWSTDSVTTAGGWGGIQLQAYIGSVPDSSTLQYCNVSYTKFDSADYSDPTASFTLIVQRSILISNCNFFNNRINPNSACHLFWVNDSCTIANSSFYDNILPTTLISIFAPANCYGNKIYQNSVGSTVVLAASATNFYFENNKLYNNTQTQSQSFNSVLEIEDCDAATIFGNSIYNNYSYGDGAIICDGGLIDINGNLICNNQSSPAGVGCGAVDGGGGLDLSCNGCDPSTTYYTVRNNVIANNYSPQWGGAIYIYHVSATITNNQIINNRSNSEGAMYILEYTPITKLVIKNNIFYGNIDLADSLESYPTMMGGATTGDTIEYDHNWSQNYSATDLGGMSGCTFTGDTATDITGTTPDLINPTSTAEVAESALSADFRLLPASACINAGDSTGADCYSVDFWGEPRIYGPAVDIGACEFNPAEFAHTGIANNTVPKQEMLVYPNPACNILYVSTPGAQGTITLLDITGRTVMEEVVGNTLNSMDVHAVARGTYFVTWGNNGTAKMAQKVVLE